MAEKFYKKVKLNVADVYPNKQISAAAMLRVMNDTAYWQLDAQKPSCEDLMSRGKTLLLNNIDLQFTGEAGIADELTVYAWLCAPTGFTYPRCYEAYLGDKLVAKASAKWVLVDIKERKLLSPFDEDISGCYIGDWFDAVSDKRLRIPSQINDEMQKIGFHKVSLSNCDYNGHMNNVQSLIMLCDYIPELSDGTAGVDHVRLHFLNEAPLDDELTVNMCKKDGTYSFRTVKADGRTNIEAEIVLKY